jgi:hypothetical protein
MTRKWTLPVENRSGGDPGARGPAQLGSAVKFTSAFGQHLGGLAVKQRGLISPVLDGFDRGGNQQWMAADHIHL